MAMRINTEVTTIYRITERHYLKDGEQRLWGIIEER